MPTPRTHSRWSAWWPFALLCLLTATRGLLAEPYPDSSTTLLSASIGYAAVALILLFTSRVSYSVFQNTATPRPALRTWFHRISAEPLTLLAGTLVLSGPLASLVLTGHGINANSLTLALALVPIVAVIAQNALSNAAPGSFAARTWPALAALAGLLLIVPQPSFANPVTDAVLILAPLATGIGAALFVNSENEHQLSALAPSLSAAALLFAVAWLIHFFLHHAGAHFSPLAALLDGATAFLALLALRRIGLSRWCAQFALVPLAVILQFFVLFRPTFDLYKSAGLALLVLGCIFLLLPQPVEKAF